MRNKFWGHVGQGQEVWSLPGLCPIHILALILLPRHQSKISKEDIEKASNKDDLPNDMKLGHLGFSKCKRQN